MKERIIKLLLKLVSITLPENDRDFLLAEFEFVFEKKFQEKGFKRAFFGSIYLILKNAPLFIANKIIWRSIMLKNYFKTSWRSIKGQKIVSSINILGLSFGLATAILITLFINDELSYDKVYKDPDNLYTVVSEFWEKPGSAQPKYSRSVPLVLTNDFTEYFPELEYATGIFYRYGTFAYKDNINNELITFASSNFFNNFGFKLVQGDPDKALKALESAVISEEIAERYFGKKDPVGEQIRMTFGSIKKSFIVSGVCRNQPENISFRYDILVNFDNTAMFKTGTPGITRLNNRGDFSAQLFLRFKDSQSRRNIENQMEPFIDNYYASTYDDFKDFMDLKEGEKPFHFFLQNVQDLRYNKTTHGGRSLSTIYLLAGIAAVILLIAAINFTNLAIGRSSVRGMEIGMRKIIGATKRDIFWQFIVEAFFTSVIAMLFGLLIAYFMLPQLNDIANKNFTVTSFFTIENITYLFLITGLVSLLSGSYPSLILSAFSPVEVIKKKVTSGGKNFFTKGLIVLQFTLSIFLVTITFVLSDQIKYMLEKDLGFEKENIAGIELQEIDSAPAHLLADKLTAGIENIAGVNYVSKTSAYFGGSGYARSYIYDRDDRYMIHRFNVDYNFHENLNMNLTAGRFFDKKRSLDSSSVVINEAFAQKLGGRAALGKELKLFGEVKLNVIGIIQNFNFNSLHQEVTPAILYVRPDMRAGNLLVNIEPGKDKEVLAEIKKIWSSLRPEKPFNYAYVDEELALQYNDEQVWKTILNFSSTLTIVIALMGVLGLTLLTISKRRKEISIRKVLGATTGQIVNLISKQFIFLVLAANLVSIPFSIYVVDKILEKFHYKIDITAAYFIAGTLAAIFITYLVSASQGIRISLANQTDNLREE